ncbi:MAG: DUF2206 domain-containing protein [Bacteroidota bacterium]|nr:DUF2206 domain-containing protein [Bacteroidota bacterium]
MEFNITPPNDWSIKKFIIFMISILLAFIGATCLDSLLINETFLLIRQIITSFFLIFIPGFIILRILKIHQINPLESLIFSVGLSISFLMFIGLCLNTALPLFGSHEPLCELNFIFVITLFILISILFVYITDKDFMLNPSCKNTVEIPINQLLFLLNLPIISAIGASFINVYEINIISLAFFLIMSLVPLVILRKFDSNLYPVAVFTSSLAILYNKSLVSMYITGWDPQVEFYFSNLVFTKSFWDLNIFSNVDSVLSTCIFIPSFSKITEISIVFVFKLIVPFIYSFLPLCLYRIFKKQFSSKVALLSIYLILFNYTFCQLENDLPRQQFAELFLSLVLLLLTDEKLIYSAAKKALNIIFMISIVVSHYGLTYVFLFLLIIAFVINKFSSRFPSIFTFNQSKSDTLKLNLLLLYISFSFFWHMSTADSSVFNSIINIGNTVLSNVFAEFFKPDSSQALYLIVNKEVLVFHQITKILHILVQLLISIGLLSVLVKNKEDNLTPEYFFYSLASYFLLCVTIAVPFVANQLNFNRFYHITLLSLAPFFYLGIHQISRVFSRNNTKKISIQFCSLFLTLFLLFNSGFVYEICGEPSYMSLNANIDYPTFVTQEVTCASWFHQSCNSSNNLIYGDSYRWLLFLGYSLNSSSFHENMDSNLENYFYFYLGKENLLKNDITIPKRLTATTIISEKVKIEKSFIPKLVRKSNKIYDDEFAKIYLFKAV